MSSEPNVENDFITHSREGGERAGHRQCRQTETLRCPCSAELFLWRIIARCEQQAQRATRVPYQWLSDAETRSVFAAHAMHRHTDRLLKRKTTLRQRVLGWGKRAQQLRAMNSC